MESRRQFMRQDTNVLRIPGPSPIPPSVQRAMSQPMIGHRGHETTLLVQDLKKNLKAVLGTEQDVLMLTSSGTSSLEAATVNATRPGDEVLVLVTGSFGDRFAQICETYELKVHRMETRWGDAFDNDEVKEFLQEHKNIKAVVSTYCETSTGVLNPIAELSQIVHEQSDALILVDGVSCVGGVDAQMDEWGVDIFITGSQKAMMLPPGLSFIGVSERAWDVIEANDRPRFYLDLRKYKKSLADDSTPFTPAVSLLFGLQQVLQLFQEEGLENVYARHTLMKNMTRAAMRALDVPLLTAEESASPTVTAIEPNDFDGEALRKIVKKEFGLDLAGGQGHQKGKVVRIGHMGYCTPADVLQIIGIIEIGLRQLGKNIQLGQGMAAAQEIYLATGGNQK